jgi:hypothetical protein
MKRTKRPQWAANLTAKEWSNLKECQATERPTLRALREDVSHQESNRVKCWPCYLALQRVEGKR